MISQHAKILRSVDGCTPLCGGCTQKLRRARARACAQVGGDNLEFAVAHLLRPGAAVGHVLSPGSVADNNKRHKEAAQAGTGPRFTEIHAHVSSACARARARHLSVVPSAALRGPWLCVCKCEGGIVGSMRARAHLHPLVV